jgi:amidase
MKILSKSHQHTHYDKGLPPVFVVEPGEEVTIETADASNGQIRSVEQFLQYREKTNVVGNPLTGPVAVKGAMPGSTLIVEILKVELVDSGFQLIGPSRAIIDEEISEWTCYEIRVCGEDFLLPNGIKMPAEPVVGTFGNAPAGKPTNQPNCLGGNYDVPAVCAGCKLYIPIEVPGALFSLGDVHACQGDGEVVGAPEVSARVTVRFSLFDGRWSEWFMIEDKEYWHSACPAKNESQAAKLAVFHNARFIAREYDIEFKDALVLLTMVGKLSISRTGKWGDYEPVVCSSFSKAKVADSLIHYRRQKS